MLQKNCKIIEKCDRNDNFTVQTMQYIDNILTTSNIYIVNTRMNPTVYHVRDFKKNIEKVTYI